MAGVLEQLLGGGGGAPVEGAPVAVPPDAGALPPEIDDPEPDLAPAPAAPQGGTDEVGVLKQLIDLGRQYTDIPTVEESERLEMEKATTIFQKLLASNEKMADSLTGADPATRKALGAGG